MAPALTEFQQRAAAQALVKLLNGSIFYVSDLRRIAELLGKRIPKTDELALEGLHCVEWSSMSPELREMLREKILEILELPPGTISIVSPASPASEAKHTPSKIFRLIGFK